MDRFCKECRHFTQDEQQSSNGQCHPPTPMWWKRRPPGQAVSGDAKTKCVCWFPQVALHYCYSLPKYPAAECVLGHDQNECEKRCFCCKHWEEVHTSCLAFMGCCRAVVPGWAEAAKPTFADGDSGDGCPAWEKNDE